MNYGGAERQLSLLARSLHARGLKVTVAVFYSGGPLERELLEGGVPLLDLKKSGRWSNFGVIKRLLRFISLKKPKVFHAYMPSQNVLALILRPWIKLNGGSVVCGLRVAALELSNYDFFERLVNISQWCLLPYADRVISNSAAALRELGNRIPPDRGAVIPNGVEYERFLLNDDARDLHEPNWPIPIKSKVIGLVGRLDPQKNHKLLLQAFSKIYNDNPDLYIAFVGGGSSDYKFSVEMYAKSLSVYERIIWIGPSSDMASVYYHLDILCLCSEAEGFPNVVGEAMSAGLPCIVTDVGDSAAVVGDCGWIVPEGDSDALAAALSLALSQLDEWDPEIPRRRIIEHYGVDRLTNRTLAVLAPYLK